MITEARDILAEVETRPTLARVVAAGRALEALHEQNQGLFQPKSVAIVRNFTLEPLEPYFRLAGFAAGLRLSLKLSGYDAAEEEVADLAREHDAVFLFLRPEEMAPALTDGFLDLDGRDAIALAQGFTNRVVSLARAASPTPTFVHNFAPPVWPAAGILDFQQPMGQVNLFRRMNLDLVAQIQATEGVHLIDLEHILSVQGIRCCYDSRSSRMADAPFTPEALRAIAAADLRFLRALAGPRMKCIVVDCDNTLWGGVIGEDGIAGIALGESGAGRAHRDFQQHLRNLKRRGILLAITSKNEEADVLEVLRDHPDCLLNQDDFVTMRINWDGKSTNIKSIAAELNLGLEHIAFIDDDEFECGDVAAQLPSVTVLRWPTDVDADQGIDGNALVDALVVTEEDAARTDLYRSETGRRMAAEAAASPEEYLKSLDLRASIGRAGKSQLARLAQLTQRTNQFNLRTRRYDTSELDELMGDRHAAVLWLQLQDRFGSHGIVGCGIIRVLGEEALIDTFLLSCRVLGRRAEAALLNRLSQEARSLGASVLVGEFLPSGRNGQVADLYARMGFEGPENTESGTLWRWWLAHGDPEPPFWIAIEDAKNP